MASEVRGASAHPSGAGSALDRCPKVGRRPGIGHRLLSEGRQLPSAVSGHQKGNLSRELGAISQQHPRSGAGSTSVLEGGDRRPQHALHGGRIACMHAGGITAMVCAVDKERSKWEKRAAPFGLRHYTDS